MIQDLHDDIVSRNRVTQTDVVPGAIKPRHLEAGLAAVKFGLAADRPDEGGTYPIWFALDTGILSIWDGDSWVAIN